MASFNDLSNLALWRMQSHGVNFGGAPSNQSTDQNPPYLIGLLLNQGYAEFMSRTIGAGVAPLKVYTPTVANATSISIRPIPPNGATINPAALRVLEVTYTQQTGLPNAGYEYLVSLVSTDTFAMVAGAYTRRLSWFGPRIEYAARLFRRPQLDVLPGTATAGDLVGITCIPDIANAPAGLTCANGGPMVNGTDVPLIAPEFHQALVEYVIANAGDAASLGPQVKYAADRWEQYILRAQEEGGTEDGGEPMVLVDKYVATTFRDG